MWFFEPLVIANIFDPKSTHTIFDIVKNSFRIINKDDRNVFRKLITSGDYILSVVYLKKFKMKEI